VQFIIIINKSMRRRTHNSSCVMSTARHSDDAPPNECHHLRRLFAICGVAMPKLPVVVVTPRKELAGLQHSNRMVITTSNGRNAPAAERCHRLRRRPVGDVAVAKLSKPVITPSEHLAGLCGVCELCEHCKCARATTAAKGASTAH
jgi:hypothetical protein